MRADRVDGHLEAIRNRQEWSSEAIGLAMLTGPACLASPRRRTSGSTRPSMAGTAAGLIGGDSRRRRRAARLGARPRTPPRAMRRVQLRGARWPHARRTLYTLSVRSRDAV